MDKEIKKIKKKVLKEEHKRQGLTRKIFLYGSILHALAFLALLIAIYIPYVTNDDIQSWLNFLPISYASLSTAKIGGRFAEAIEGKDFLKEKGI